MGLVSSGADVDGPLPYEISSRLGAHASLTGAWDLSEHVRLQAEMAAQRWGWNADGIGIDGSVGSTYLELPLLALVRVPLKAPVGMHLIGGGALGFEIGCQANVALHGTRMSGECDDPELEIDRRKTEWGIRFGGGLNLDRGAAEFVLDVQRHVGLSDLDPDPGADQVLRMRAWLVSVGLAYRVGGRLKAG
jgi:hypothetical protein